MQRLFIIREGGEGMEQVHEFIDTKGKIISVNRNSIATGTANRMAGRWLIVADDGKGGVEL